MIRNNSATVSITAPGSLNQLICACSDPVLTTCSSNGYNVTVSSRNWAGLAHVETTQLYTQPARSTIVNLTAYEENEVYEGNDFQVQSCSRTGDFCSRSLDVDWPLRSTNPCIAVDNRTGLLCAACQDGTTLVALDAYVSTSTLSESEATRVWPLSAAPQCLRIPLLRKAVVLCSGGTVQGFGPTMRPQLNSDKMHWPWWYAQCSYLSYILQNND